jgi:hypothetical protein
MTVSPPEPVTKLGERITVTLIPKAGADLQRLKERTDLSTTDLANRAITLYEFIDAQLRAGQQMIARDSGTGTIKLVRFLDAPAGQAMLTGSACARRARAGYERQPRRQRRHYLVHGWPIGLAITSRLLPLIGLTGQGVRTR